MRIPKFPFLAATATTSLALALACGGGPEPGLVDDEPASSGTSLGDLMGADPAPAPAAATTPPTPPPATTPAPLPDLLPAPGQQEVQVQETAECTQARGALSAERARVDSRRAQAIADAERDLARGQLSMQNCIKTYPCNQDAEAMAAAHRLEEAAETAYQAAMRRIAGFEAGLFSYEQAVDRACGRR